MEPKIEMSFSEALKFLKMGQLVSRSGWNGVGQYLCLQVPDENSKMKRPYIYISPVDAKFVPWIASQTDLLAEDWFVFVLDVPENK